MIMYWSEQRYWDWGFECRSNRLNAKIWWRGVLGGVNEMGGVCKCSLGVIRVSYRVSGGDAGRYRWRSCSRQLKRWEGIEGLGLNSVLQIGMLQQKGLQCLKKNKPAALFCCTEGCSYNAFGCSKQCLSGHNHPPQMNPKIEECSKAIQTIKQFLKIEQDDEQYMQIQEKHFKQMFNFLQSTMTDHKKFILNCKSNTKIRETLFKMDSSFKNANYEGLTGDVMAELWRNFDNKEFQRINFDTKEKICKRRKIFDELIYQIEKSLDDYKKKIQHIFAPPSKSPQKSDSMSQFLQIKSVPDFDIAAHPQILLDKATAFTLTPCPLQFHPVFLSQQITQRRVFQIVVEEYNTGAFMVGIAPISHKNKIYDFDSKQTICLSMKSKCLYGEGTYRDVNFGVRDGERVKVRVDMRRETVEWENGHNRVRFQMLPNGIHRRQKMYPVCWIRGHPTEQRNIPKLRFV